MINKIKLTEADQSRIQEWFCAYDDQYNATKKDAELIKRLVLE